MLIFGRNISTIIEQMSYNFIRCWPTTDRSPMQRCEEIDADSVSVRSVVQQLGNNSRGLLIVGYRQP